MSYTDQNKSSFTFLTSSTSPLLSIHLPPTAPLFPRTMQWGLEHGTWNHRSAATLLQNTQPLYFTQTHSGSDVFVMLFPQTTPQIILACLEWGKINQFRVCCTLPSQHPQWSNLEKKVLHVHIHVRASQSLGSLSHWSGALLHICIIRNPFGETPLFTVIGGEILLLPPQSIKGNQSFDEILI